MHNYLKKAGIILLLLLASGTLQKVQAQDPILAVIKAGITKAIVAMDLKIQRLQNRTIWLQNAQKVLENKLAALRLTEIADWTERQRQLYDQYYRELWQVKAAIAYYHRVEELVQKQGRMLEAYRHTYRLLQQDGNFTPSELRYIREVYSSLLEASLQELDLLQPLLNSFTTQMSDGKRLELLQEIAGNMDRIYNTLRIFNEQHIRLGLQRAKERRDLKSLRQLYGVQSL